MIKTIIKELTHHAPYTMMGAILGILMVLVGYRFPQEYFHKAFYVFHPAHVLLSAIATTSIYQLQHCSRHEHRCNPWVLIAIGYFGSIGITTLSDSVIPYIGEKMMGFPGAESHIGFLEAWWFINAMTFAGIGIAYIWPQTKLPHMGHIFFSTMASLFHMMMALGGDLRWTSLLGIFVFLFLAVWLPCCLSDIVFPLLFIRDSKRKNAVIDHHYHS